METRMERNKRLRKERFFRSIKSIIITIIIFFMAYGLYLVNDSIKGFDIIENDNLFSLDIKKRTIDLFGKSYYIDFHIIKDIF